MSAKSSLALAWIAGSMSAAIGVPVRATRVCSITTVSIKLLQCAHAGGTPPGCGSESVDVASPAWCAETTESIHRFDLWLPGGEDRRTA